ncbi:MAG TPA: GGDEF domain-containing protein [Polyangiaceae bacterium]|nr:GGDEF domain-containing protein [Polyangiaceae bacterium]
MVKQAGFYPSDKPDPVTPRPTGTASVPVPRMRLASISEDDSSPFREERTLDISLRSNDFGSVPSPQPLLRDRAMLLRMDGVGAGQVLSVSQAPFTMGRHATNRLPIDDDSISRFHARFVCEEGKYFIEDLGSRNGTFLQGKRVTRAEVKDDDWVQLGARVAFRFTLTDARQEGLLRKLYESSTRDALTGAYNRRHFEDRLRAELAFAVRHATDCALILLDIDHFKRVNDTYGHPAGDEVLRHLAGIATRALRTEDVFARFGGEEFAVILRGASTRGAGRLAERLREALSQQPALYEGQPITTTLSAGCAALSCCATPSPDEVIAIADRRLYAAKQGGRNRVVASD